jgi:hypothetical protein
MVFTRARIERILASLYGMGSSSLMSPRGFASGRKETPF